MLGSNLSYNGVTLTDVQTLRFEQATEYDESRTDKIFDRFVIRVSGSVHNQQGVPGVSSGHGVRLSSPASLLPTSATAIDTMELVRRQLMQPRGWFRFEIGPEQVLTATPLPAQPDSDVNGGPKPLSCNITRIFGRALFAVEFEIEVCRVLCDAGQSANLASLISLSAGALENIAVLNNRWRITEEIDQHMKRFRTLEGVLRVSHLQYWPHAFRALCVPSLAKGFQRKRMAFTDTPDGLTLHYSILDEERSSAPPPPALDWQATCSEISGVGGQVGFTEMHVKLTGAPDVDKQALLTAIEKTIEARINNARNPAASQGQGTYAAVLEHMAIVEHLHEPIVEAHVRVRHQTNDPNSLLNTRAGQIGKPLDTITGYDAKRWPRPGVWIDASPYGAFSKYFQSPCWPVHGVPTPVYPDPASGGQNPQGDPGQGEDTPEQQNIIFHGEQSSIPGWDDQTASDTTQITTPQPYSYYRVNTEYDTRDGVMRLPVARWGGAAATPGPASVLIPLHQPMTDYIIIVHAERIGAWPEVPTPLVQALDLNGIAGNRSDRGLFISAPQVLADGKTRLFSLQCRFKYLLERTPTTAELFASGTVPMDSFSADDNAINGPDVFK